MGLSWQQGPLGGASPGRFLTPQMLPKQLLFAEPLRRRLRVMLAGEWIADSENVLLLHEPGLYPVAFFPSADIRPGILVRENRTSQHRELGAIAWFTVVSFELDEVEVALDGKRLVLEPSQTVIPHGIARGLVPEEILKRSSASGFAESPRPEPREDLAA